MASETDTQKPSDLTVCSICFENFRTPRILPCAHVFCHGCISSYIVTSCQSKEAHVGFSCPLCRKFVPSPSDLSNPEKWADGLPVCKIFNMLNKQETKLCAACLRENEEDEATDFCVTCQESMCRNCVKYHKRSLASSNHSIVSLKEPMAVLRSATSVKNSRCPEHPDREEELYCIGHKKVCCTICASTCHNQCVNFTTVQSMAEKTIKQGHIHKLIKTIDSYQQELLEIKENEDQNLKDISNASNAIKDDILKLRKEVNEHLDKIEKEQLDELNEITKESSENLRKTIGSVSERIFLSDHYKKTLRNLEDTSNAYLVREYDRVCKGFDSLRFESMQRKDKQLKLQYAISKEANEIKNVKCLFSMKLLDPTGFKVFRFLFSLVLEMDIVPHDDVYCGDLSNGILTLAKYGSSKVGLQQYSVHYGMARQTTEYQSFNCFFGLAVKDNFFYATDRNETCVSVISSDSLALAKTIPVETDFIPYGVCLWDDYIFIACQTAILKYDIHGRFIESYPVEFNTLFVTATTPGNVVYSNTTKNYVASINSTGKQLWKYTNPKLHSPHGVDKDENDNLFVASTATNTVHILTYDGVLRQIIEGISKPVFMKVDESNSMCCVCSNYRRIKIYRIY